jgi:hypothetical protein
VASPVHGRFPRGVAVSVCSPRRRRAALASLLSRRGRNGWQSLATDRK